MPTGIAGTFATLALAIAGCAGGSSGVSSSMTATTATSSAPSTSSSPTPRGVIRVGFVSSLTGARTQAAQSERFVIDKVVDHVDAHPIETGKANYTLEVLVRDAASSADGAARAA